MLRLQTFFLPANLRRTGTPSVGDHMRHLVPMVATAGASALGEANTWVYSMNMQFKSQSERIAKRRLFIISLYNNKLTSNKWLVFHFRAILALFPKRMLSIFGAFLA